MPPFALISLIASSAPLAAGRSSDDSAPVRSKPRPILIVSSCALTIDRLESSSAATSVTSINTSVDRFFIFSLLKDQSRMNARYFLFNSRSAPAQPLPNPCKVDFPVTHQAAGAENDDHDEQHCQH